ncbi:MAG: hypothetical protein M3619_24995, partial [Myxococcota bacterium]|nr:hypothetical protein [Myxococcota bacterium]
NWRDDRTLIKEAWLLCCRHAGAPWPFAADELEAERRKQLAARVRLPTMLFCQADEIEQAVTSLAEIDAALVDALRPAIDACTMAADLLAEVRRQYDAAEAHLKIVKQRVLAGDVGDAVAFEALKPATKSAAAGDRLMSLAADAWRAA